ncbi:MAG: TetR/AcrR family transcriptional regulator [Bacteriovoracaceae bacterium]|nr:TetR/AcrR family transcriptional regulator [Bacteriovoracaceae bacterium]
MNKTKLHILDTAFQLARTVGLESLTIGSLAKKVGMSKSGLFAHFHSKEMLQIMILDYTDKTFTTEIVAPAIKLPRGIGRLMAIMDGWVKWTTDNGSCPLIAAAIEFDDRPGKVKIKVEENLKKLHMTLSRACQVAVEAGDIPSENDPDQMAQEIFGHILSYHLYQKVMRDKSALSRFETSMKNTLSVKGGQS